jgi:Cu/Ag efflux protein CusF
MRRFSIALISALFLLPPAYADDAHHTQAALADGVIRKVDKKAKKLTIKHGPIRNIDMPAMTMVFRVKDPRMVDQVKAGDKVKFQAEMLAGGEVTVTRIEAAK